MDVLTAEAIYQHENRKSGLLKVFQPQRSSLSQLTQLFSKAKAPAAGVRGIQAQVANPGDRGSDLAYIVRALCGGVEANTLKASVPKARNLTVNEAVGLVEQAAAQLTSDVRERVLQTWCTILAADQGYAAFTAGTLSPSIKARHCWSAHTAAADQAAHTSATQTAAEPDHAVAAELDALKLGSGAVGGGTQCSRQPSCCGGTADNHESHPTPAPVLQLTLMDDNKPVQISFREVFLKSSGLELVVKSFLEEPSTDTEEILLHQLLQLSLSKTPAEQSSSALVDAIVKLSSSMLHPHIQALPHTTLRDVVSQAVGSLKAAADLDKLDRQMEEVQAELTTLLAEWNDCDTQDQAATIAGDASRMEGPPALVASMEPLQESMRWKIAQKAWELASELKGLATQRHAILEHQAAFDYTTLRKMVDEPAASVGADVAGLQQQLDETRSQLQQGAGFRSERFGKVKEQLVGMASEISGLEARRMALMAELAKLDDDLRRLYKRQSELEEERNMFEEGSSLTLEGLTVQVSALEATQAVALMEATTLRNASALVALAESTAAQASSTALRESEECRQAATDKVQAAAQRFCELQHLELSRCVSTMKSAAAEISDISTTQMYDDILHQQALEAVEARRQAAIETYLDAEMAAMGILGELAQVQDSVRIQYRSLSRLTSTSGSNAAVGSDPSQPAQPPTGSQSAPQSPNAWPAQLAMVMPQLDFLRAEFEAFDRPDEVTKYSISSMSSRHLSASLSHLSATSSGYQAGPLASRPGSSKLMAGGAAHAGDPAAGLEQEPGGSDLPATCDTNLISYMALMEAPDGPAADPAERRQAHSASASMSSKHSSMASSPDRVAAAARKAAAAATATGGRQRAGGDAAARTGSDLDLQALDRDAAAT